MNNLVDYYYTNLQKIYQRVKTLWQEVYDIFLPTDDAILPDMTITKPNEQVLNREVYRWTLHEMHHLQFVVDYLVGFYNENGVVDVETLNNTETIKLWQPTSLVVDAEYQSKLADDFKRVNDLLDQLDKYAKDNL